MYGTKFYLERTQLDCSLHVTFTLWPMLKWALDNIINWSIMLTCYYLVNHAHLLLTNKMLNEYNIKKVNTIE